MEFTLCVRSLLCCIKSTLTLLLYSLRNGISEPRGCWHLPSGQLTSYGPQSLITVSDSNSDKKKQLYEPRVYCVCKKKKKKK